MNYDEMIQSLETSGDFKVLRKLKEYDDACLPMVFSDDPSGSMQDFVILDFETTGLDHTFDEGISLGAIHFTYDILKGVVHSINRTIYQLNQPQNAGISEEITRITGLTLADVRGHSFNIEEFEEFVGDLDATIILAHNAQFDYKFFGNEGFNNGPLANVKWLCTANDVQWLQDYHIESKKLEYILFKQGIFYGSHNAMTDCWATLQALEATEGTIGDLVELANQDLYTVKAVGSPFAAKDDLKKRKFQWDAPNKVWQKTNLLDAQVVEELKAIDESYGGADRAEITKQQGNERFA